MALSFLTPPDAQNATGRAEEQGQVSEVVYTVKYRHSPHFNTTDSLFCYGDCTARWWYHRISTGVRPATAVYVVRDDLLSTFYRNSSDVDGIAHVYAGYKRHFDVDEVTNVVDIRNPGALYTFIARPVGFGNPDLQAGRSKWFKFNILDWNYTSGTPIDQAKETTEGDMSLPFKVAALVSIAFIIFFIIAVEGKSIQNKRRSRRTTRKKNDRVGPIQQLDLEDIAPTGSVGTTNTVSTFVTADLPVYPDRVLTTANEPPPPYKM